MRILIVDDHKIVRKGICAFLSEIDGIEVIGEAASGQEAVQLVQSIRPDVVLMDILMPVMDGIEAVRQIHLHYQDVRMLVMTTFIVEEKLFAALLAGAHNYILKESLPDELIEKLQYTYHCETDLHPRMTSRFIDAFSKSGSDPQLTEQQNEILTLLEGGLTIEEAALKLDKQQYELRQQLFKVVQELHNLSQN